MATLGNKNAAMATVPEYTVGGEPTERCILDLAVALMGAPQATKQLLSAHPRLAEIPFDSATKYMATLHALTPELAQLAMGKIHIFKHRQYSCVTDSFSRFWFSRR